jgi:hypothetical protein
MRCQSIKLRYLVIAVSLKLGACSIGVVRLVESNFGELLMLEDEATEPELNIG